MIRRLLITAAIGALIAAGIAQAHAQPPSVEARVDRTTVRENESFTYVIRAEGAVLNEPDLGPIARDFDILQQVSSTRVQIVAGRTMRVTEWTLQLMPQRTGRITLPPVDVSGGLTSAIEVEVLPAPSSAAAADVFMEIEVEPQSPYVLAQVTYTLKLYSAVNTGRATLTAPEVIEGDAIIERLADDREYQTVLDGRNFVVRERRYVVFPQTPGRLTIGPVIFEATVMPSRGFSRVQRARSQAVELDVRGVVPPPPQWAHASWLPARRVTLTEEWGEIPSEFVVGVPRTRTVITEAEGLQEMQLPALELPRADGLRFYPGQAELSRQQSDAGLTARRVEPFAVIAQVPGEVALPALELPWWNVDAHRWEVARLEPTRVDVLPNMEPSPVSEEPAPDPAAAGGVAPRGPWPFVSVGLLIAWLATLGLWLRTRAASGSIPPRGPLARRAANRRLLKALRGACERDDPGQTRQLLLDWAKLRFDRDPPRTLGALAARLPQCPLADEIRALEAHEYGRDGESWDGSGLQQALAGVESVADATGRDRGDALLSLYR